MNERPRESADEHDPSSTPGSAEQITDRQLDPAKILLVEDESINQAMIASWLRGEGYRPRIAESGEEAVEELSRGSYDLVLLDIVLPGMNGFDVLERIREEQDVNTLPVIMLTSRNESEDIIRAFRLGANDYATKPVDFEVLSRRIEAHLQHSKGSASLIKNFHIERKIGAGGMGVVYECTHIDSGIRMAVKVLHRSMTYDDEYVSRFMREARLMSRVNHPNVVQVVDAGRCDETYYLAMELVEGKNLYDLAREAPLAQEVAILVGKQVASALAALQDEGIMHRDIKPENIILTADGTAKLTDFGIAREIKEDTRQTEPGVGFGSIAYVSPEQMVGKGDHRADIYSLGSTLFFVLTSEDPFRTDVTPETTLKKKMASPPLSHQVNRSVHPKLSMLLARMMHPQERARIKSYDAILKELEKIEDSLRGDDPEKRRSWWPFSS